MVCFLGIVYVCVGGGKEREKKEGKKEKNRTNFWPPLG